MVISRIVWPCIDVYARHVACDCVGCSVYAKPGQSLDSALRSCVHIPLRLAVLSVSHTLEVLVVVCAKGA